MRNVKYWNFTLIYDLIAKTMGDRYDVPQKVFLVLSIFLEETFYWKTVLPGGLATRPFHLNHFLDICNIKSSCKCQNAGAFCLFGLELSTITIHLIGLQVTFCTRSIV